MDKYFLSEAEFVEMDKYLYMELVSKWLNYTLKVFLVTQLT